jgi:hypothetical protein
MKHQTHISITEVTILTGRKKAFKIDINGSQVSIPVDESLFTNYLNQFSRPNPTVQQKQRFLTLMNLIRAAYIQGQKDASQ